VRADHGLPADETRDVYPAEAGHLADGLADDDDGAAPGADCAVAAGSADPSGRRVHGVAPVSVRPDPRQGVNFGPWRASFPLVCSRCFMPQTGQASRALRSVAWLWGCTSIEKC
jgi:hypothetical protein